MQQDTPPRSIDAEPPAYVTLLAVQREVGISRGTLKKYLTYLGIEPICLHIGTRSLYISREAMTLVRQLKQHPASLLHLSSQHLLPGRAERDGTGDVERKDVSHGC
jgi:hypothetical protein